MKKDKFIPFKSTESINDFIDMNSGEIVDQSKEKHEVVSVGDEPYYYKVYLEDLAKIQGLNPSEAQLIQVLAKHMSFSNIVVLIKPVIEIICSETGKEFETIKKAIQGLTKKGIIIRQGRSVYLVNPNYVAKGKWEEIKALRLVLHYNAQGRKIQVEEITKNSIKYRIDGSSDFVLSEGNQKSDCHIDSNVSDDKLKEVFNPWRGGPKPHIP